ncbi:MAG: response regulator [Burkholderiales bacterium]
MKHYEIPPFYFPTTVHFVDDNADFLANLSLQLDPNLAFYLHDSAVDALVALNGSIDLPSPLGRFFSLYKFSEELPLSHHVIDLDMDKIFREVHNEYRFTQASVAIVDYDMPRIDGIEFCRNIRNPAVKKILLTGKADANIAVQAFNQGVIDRFIMKQDEAVIRTLNQAIMDLQLAYFRQTERTLADALSFGSHDFIRDPLFAGLFREICASKQIIEFYLCNNPEGMLMLDSNGVSYRLIVMSDEDLISQYEIAYDEGAPETLLQALKSGKVLPYFLQSGGTYGPICQDWRSYLYPATEFQGKQWYYYTLIENPPSFKPESILSYNEFLDQMDQKGRGSAFDTKY